MEERQQTLKQSLTIQGEALHTGKMVTMTLIPQPEDTGIRFCRSDLPGKPVLPARPEHVVDTYRCTTIGNNTWQIKTIEHLMAALHGLGVDNLLVEVEGEELPMGDGSAWFFARAILEAGLVEQEKSRRKWKITTPVWVENGNSPRSYLLALPGDQLHISYVFTSNNSSVGNQFYQLRVTPETFQEELASARTIAFTYEIEALRRQGLALGGNLDVAVVVGEEGYLNDLRYPDEIARHKILDILGDLYLLGPVTGKIIGIGSGHKMDLELVLRLKENLR
ncbi:MAG: UDP-3-O-[3-hydroxymyristoyl] N-acetylglucosamine deacetylase [Firmicutes bacterium]|nr:UDP-3-O-[3-hydroxymyristoyl] N-acetylglucosamine deacetylase [Bacillota bacterium]